MARVAGFQRVLQPTARPGAQTGLDEIEVLGVFDIRGFRLEQEDDLGREERDAGGCPHSDTVEPLRDGGVPPEHPRSAGRLVEQKLDAGTVLRYRMDLVDRRIKPFPIGPWKPLAIHDLLERPCGEMRPKFGLVLSKDRHIDVVMLPTSRTRERDRSPILRRCTRGAETLA